MIRAPRSGCIWHDRDYKILKRAHCVCCSVGEGTWVCHGAAAPGRRARRLVHANWHEKEQVRSKRVVSSFFSCALYGICLWNLDRHASSVSFAAAPRTMRCRTTSQNSRSCSGSSSVRLPLWVCASMSWTGWQSIGG